MYIMESLKKNIDIEQFIYTSTDYIENNKYIDSFSDKKLYSHQQMW